MLNDLRVVISLLVLAILIAGCATDTDGTDNEATIDAAVKAAVTALGDR